MTRLSSVLLLLLFAGTAAAQTAGRTSEPNCAKDDDVCKMLAKPASSTAPVKGGGGSGGGGIGSGVGTGGSGTNAVKPDLKSLRLGPADR